MSPATYSALNADALELENAVWVAVANLFPIDVAILAEKLASSFKAAANSSNVSKVAGAELTIPATLASIYVFWEELNAVSAATYSLLSAVATELLNELLALVAKPLIASLWVWADELKLVLAVVWAPSKATYSALNAVAVELLNELLAEVCAVFNWFLLTSAEALNAVNSASEAKSVSNAAIEAELILNKASLWVCAELLRVVLAVVWALSPATISALNAVAVEELRLELAVVCALSPAVISALNAVAIELLKLLLAVVWAPSKATYSALNAVAAELE